MDNEQKKVMDNILDSLENDNMKELGSIIFQNLPDYWYEVPASSSGKYHPLMSAGPQGLFRHSLAVETFMDHILSIDQYKNEFRSEERDALKIAAFVHDGEKHGKDKSGGHTVFNHPICMAETIRTYKGKIEGVDDDIIEFMAECISSHMGQWNTNSREPNIILPLPETEGQKLLHLADYLASRKDIEIHFEEKVKYENPTPDNYVFNFGKHKGKTFNEVLKKDKSYLEWLKGQKFVREPLKTFLKTI